MCFRGSYIEQAYLSALWQHIHQSPVVDIRRVKAGKRNKRGVANYLAKYMSKELVKRYSWSWGWVYKGFVATWKKALSLWRGISLYIHPRDFFFNFLALWQLHLRTHSPPDDFLTFLQAKRKQAETASPS